MRANLKRHVEQVWALLMYPIRKRQVLEKQRREGYTVEIPAGSRGEYVVYRDGDRSLSAFVDISLGAGVRLYTQTITKWEAPLKGEDLTQSEYELALCRIRNYLSLEGEVTLDDSSLMTRKEQSVLMNAAISKHEGWTTTTEGGQVKFVRDPPNQ